MEAVKEILADPDILDTQKVAKIYRLLEQHGEDDPELAHELEIKTYEKFIYDVAKGIHTIAGVQEVARKVISLKKLKYVRGY